MVAIVYNMIFQYSPQGPAVDILIVSKAENNVHYIPNILYYYNFKRNAAIQCITTTNETST